MNCGYCYAQGGDYGGGERRISPSLAIRKVSEVANVHHIIKSIQFIGGEPLLNLPAIRAVCEFSTKLFKEGVLDERPNLSAVTNLTVLTDEHIAVFCEYDVSLTISLDGDKDIHDITRPTKTGKGTHQTILNNIDRLKKANIKYSFEATYTKAHYDKSITIVQILKYLSSFSPERIDVTVVSTDKKSVLGFSNKKEQQIIVQYHIEAIDFVLRELSNGRIVPYGFLSDIIGYIKTESSQYFCPAGISNLAIASDGNIYGCHMFTNNNNYLVTDICKGETNGKSDVFMDIPVILTNNETTYLKKKQFSQCQECWVFLWCRGCLGNMEIRSPSQPKPFNQHCELMKRSFEYVIQRLPDAIDMYVNAIQKPNKANALGQ